MINCEIFKDRKGEYRWRTRNTRNKKITATSGEGYKRKFGAKRSFSMHQTAFTNNRSIQILDLTKPTKFVKARVAKRSETA